MINDVDIRGIGNATSFDKPAKMFEGISGEKGRFHPTQKPIALYSWLLNNYAKPGDKILDTHAGSASSLIACHRLGFDYVGFEIDKDYYDAALARLAKEKSQVRIEDYVAQAEQQTLNLG